MFEHNTAPQEKPQNTFEKEVPSLIASIAALRGGANISAYSTSKAAVIGLTQSFAQELGPKE